MHYWLLSGFPAEDVAWRRIVKIVGARRTRVVEVDSFKRSNQLKKEEDTSSRKTGTSFPNRN
jgi:hypothetical protein